jgi:mutator protein MutT
MYRYCSICGGRLKLNKEKNLACSRCRFINYRNSRPTVTALVLRKNKLLLVKRAKAPFSGWWDLPGGFIERGETAEQALRRELKEETGLRAFHIKFFGTYVGTYPFGFDPFHILSVVYLVINPKGEPKAMDDVSASRWFDKKELSKKIAFDSNQKIIKDFLKIWK